MQCGNCCGPVDKALDFVAATEDEFNPSGDSLVVQCPTCGALGLRSDERTTWYAEVRR